MEKLGADWSDSRVAERAATVAIRGIRWCVMNTSVSTHSSDLSVFLRGCHHFLPHCDSLPLPSPPRPLLIIITPFPSLTLWLWCLFMPHSSLFSSALPPCRSSSHPSVPYHYYEPSGPDECTMYLSHERSRRGSHHRFITEKKVFANWARTRNIHFYQPDWKPTAVATNMNSSYTPGSWGSLQGQSQKCRICAWTDSSVQLLSAADMNAWDSSRTDHATVVAVSLLPKLLGRMGSLHNSGSTKPQQCFRKCNYNRMNFILESKPWRWAQVYLFFFFALCRAALITLELSDGHETVQGCNNCSMIDSFSLNWIHKGLWGHLPIVSVNVTVSLCFTHKLNMVLSSKLIVIF